MKETVRKTGQLVLTEAAVVQAGKGIEAVQIGYDPKAWAVAIKPATLSLKASQGRPVESVQPSSRLTAGR